MNLFGRNNPRLAYNVAFVIIFLYIIYALVIVWRFGAWRTSNEFGDSFGALNALFTGVTIAGLVFTIALQRQEIETQNKQGRIQRFEGIFFNVLQLINSLFESIVHKREVFDNLSNETVANFRSLTLGADTTREYLCKQYRTRYEPAIVNLVGSYLDTISHVIHLTFDADFDKETTKKYLSLLFTQIGPAEKRIMFYHFLLGTKQNRHLDHFKLLLFDAYFQKSDIVPANQMILLEINYSEVDNEKAWLKTI